LFHFQYNILLAKIKLLSRRCTVYTPIVVFITVIFSSIVFSCSVLCKICVFCLFQFKGIHTYIQVIYNAHNVKQTRAAVSVVFPPCCPVQVLSRALCLHHVFLSEQIKIMMMICVTVYIQYRRVTDGQTDRQTERHLATA